MEKIMGTSRSRQWKKSATALHDSMRARSYIRLFVFVMIGVFVVWSLVIVQYDFSFDHEGPESRDVSMPNPIPQGLDKPNVFLRGDDEKISKQQQQPKNWLDSPKHRCEWIKSLIDANNAIGKPLPKAGVSRNGVTFWLKQPVLHTLDPDSGDEIMILKYNIYNRDPKWTQHTDKFRNTVKVLLQIDDIEIFPKLYGFCNSIDGYHYIAVEYIDFDMDAMPRPTSLDQCVDRAKKAINLFEVLDERLHLILSDFKPGQWMARKDGRLVMQDIDDIVKPRSQSPYQDQIEWCQSRLQSDLGLGTLDIDKPWKTTMFPRGELSVRYMTVNTKLLLDNLGFSWYSNCQMTPEFSQCKDELIRWTMTLGEDWPCPAQIKQALHECFETGSFTKTERPPAEWRDLEPMDESEYVPVTACLRKYDKPEAGNEFTMCKHSCCRGKGGEACYYTAPMENCAKK